MERHTARIIVVGFIERDGKLLVIRERPAELPHDHEPVMNQPAGHLEKNELLTDAVVREVLEETGYHVRPVELVGVHQITVTSEERTVLAFLFRCELIDETQHEIEAPEIVETLWLTQEEIMARANEHRSRSTTKRFETYFSGARFPLELLTQLVK
ncbi:NUDIX hydrolase [Candidatus Uhrbacteria bacterium CG10_big_fil_rev_8_21_14_0_10_48_16]|uniref:NUDIX hydrolase n=1 Tax=Candidatus Uhrbacteria bacterium CG10_big_fil_rev_8_21_14_0_10_48_16 TaxID=1975038 RepID=A0A2M8LG10_9BACT|nr:MAG: NUDIX hydrolase [Candidatus Uhrbacteria bacterium CG10_big_fil_rev_8_21_14_0_10_48_16]